MWTTVLLVIVLVICVATDLKKRIIYNAVTFPALLAALTIHAVTEGWHGLGMSLLGFVAGLGVLLIPYWLGGMGAGDVKLLAVVGALKGAAFVLTTSVYMALVGGIVALAIILFKDGFLNKFRKVGFVLFCLRSGIKIDWRGQFVSGAYPYGVAIAGGSALCLWLRGWGIA